MTGWMETQRAIVTEDDCDFNKHMSVKGYFRMFDDAAFYLLSSAGLFYGNLHARNLALATVVQRIRYLAELAEGDRYVIESAYARIGRRSLRYLHKMLKVETGEVSAAFDATEALFDFTARKSVPWPDELRAGVEPRIIELTEEDKALFEG